MKESSSNTLGFGVWSVALQGNSDAGRPFSPVDQDLIESLFTCDPESPIKSSV